MREPLLMEMLETCTPGWSAGPYPMTSGPVLKEENPVLKQSQEIPSCYGKDKPPVVPVRTLTLGIVTFINFHQKEPWSSASPLHWDPPAALPVTLPILSAPLAS